MPNSAIGEKVVYDRSVPFFILALNIMGSIVFDWNETRHVVDARWVELNHPFSCLRRVNDVVENDFRNIDYLHHIGAAAVCPGNYFQSPGRHEAR